MLLHVFIFPEGETEAFIEGLICLDVLLPVNIVTGWHSMTFIRKARLNTIPLVRNTGLIYLKF